jgi:hypothetical protein
MLTHDDEYRLKQYELPGNMRGSVERQRERRRSLERRKTSSLGVDRHQGMIAFARTVAHPAVTAAVPKGPEWSASSARSSICFPD